MQRMTVSVTTSGVAGAAVGTAALAPMHEGKLHAVYISYGSTMTASTCVQVIQSQSPSQTLLDVAATSAAAWYFPRTTGHTTTGTVLSATGTPFPVTGNLYVRAASGAASGKVQVFAWIDEQS